MLNLSPTNMTNPIDAAVAALVNARRGGQSAADVPLPDAASAYAVQDGVASALGWFGGVMPQYWKSGGPSPTAVQTHAPLPPAGVWVSPADARGWTFQFRGIEAEIALRLGQDVTAADAARLDLAAVKSLVDVMGVSIEIVDSRWTEGLAAPAEAKLADLQSHGALVLGDWALFDAEHDWPQQVCRVRIGAADERRFVGTHSMADPCWVLPAWLRHATQAGGQVPAGTMVTTGTWCGLLHAAPGDAVHVAFDGIGEARVQF